MLQPANRLTLIDAMRPPAGFRFESAMAVTYTLDLQALLVAPAALTLAQHGSVDTRGGTDDDSGADHANSTRRADGTGGGAKRYEPVELIHALRSHASQLTVFNQVGEIALPPSRQVFAFLEKAIVPVTAPRGGIVHPKVWVLRYTAAGDHPDGHPPEHRHRVLISSRNLTFDPSWDTLVRLDETTGPAGATLKPVGKMFKHLLGSAIGSVSKDHGTRVRSLANALKIARFALPDGVDGLQVHVLGLADVPSPLPRDVDRSLIISPFLSNDFFTRVHPCRIDELVSRPEWLDRLDEGLLPDAAQRTPRPGPARFDSPGRQTPNAVDKVSCFDDRSVTDRGADDDRRSPFDPGRPLVGLHAKIFAFEDGDRARLFCGSANATGAAFGSNVEILVELTGSIDSLGIDRLCDGTDEESGLRNLFYDYLRTGANGPDRKPSHDHWRHTIARLPFEGRVKESNDSWTVTYQTTEPMPEPTGVTMHCWPLTVAGNRRRVAPGEPLEARFETSLENLSGFLAFELADDEGNISSFVVPVPLVGVPEERDRLLLRSLIGNATRFFRYLLALLEDSPGEIDLLEAVERISGAAGETDPAGPMSLPVLEKLLRTMRRDAGKLAGLHPLVSDLAADNLLPEGFAELWSMIHDVATEESMA